MELPRDMIGEIRQYFQPSMKYRSKLTSTYNLDISLEDKVHAYNLKTLAGIDLFGYIWDNSLDDEFNDRDWNCLLNEEYKSPNYDNFFNGERYITQGQKSIVKSLIFKYKDLLYRIPDVKRLYILAGLHQLCDIEEVPINFRNSYIDGIAMLDDPKYYPLMDEYTEHLDRDVLMNLGVYNYGMTKSLTQRDFIRIISNMYYTPEKKNTLIKLLELVKQQANKIDFFTLFNAVSQEFSYDKNRDEKIKIIYEHFSDKIYNYIVEDNLHIFIDQFLAEGKEYDLNQYKMAVLSSFQYVRDVKTFEKFLKFFKNIQVSDYIEHIRSPIVYQHILDTQQFNLSQHTMINPRLLVLLRDHIFKIIKPTSALRSKFNLIHDLSPLEQITDNHLCYFFLEDVSKHYGIKFDYRFNHKLPQMLKEYNGTDEALLNILFNYNLYLDREKYFYLHEADEREYVHVDISKNYFTKALELCQNPEQVLRDYFDNSTGKIRRSYNFIKAFIEKFPGMAQYYVQRLIFEAKYHGLLELTNYDPNEIQKQINKLEDDREDHEDYVEYLRNLI